MTRDFPERPGADCLFGAVDSPDRILLYRDDAHLTNVAAVVLTNRLERLLTAAGALPAVAPAGSPRRPSAVNWMHDLGTCYPGCPAPQWGTGQVETMTDAADNARLDGKGALEIIPTRRACTTA